MPRHDWKLIKHEYIFGCSDGSRLTLGQLATKHGCSPSYLREKASMEGWKEEQYRRLVHPGQLSDQELRLANLKSEIASALKSRVEIELEYFVDKAKRLIAEDFAEEQQAHNKRVERLEVDSRWTWIYFVYDSSANLVKIGFSTNPLSRLDALQVSSPVKLKLTCLLPGTRKTEAALHRKFAEYREKGEWFRAEGELKLFMEIFSSTSD